MQTFWKNSKLSEINMYFMLWVGVGSVDASPPVLCIVQTEYTRMYLIYVDRMLVARIKAAYYKYR